MYDDIIAAASQKWNIPASWIQAVITVESNWDPNAFNASDPGGSRGLMQISGPTANAYGITNLDSLFDPATNIDVGTHILSDNRDSYGDDFQRVYSAYNSGNPDLWQTSSQVAAHVASAVAALAEWTTSSPAGDASIGVLIFGLVILWMKRKKT